jgi:hypothetical protein
MRFKLLWTLSEMIAEIDDNDIQALISEYDCGTQERLKEYFKLEENSEMSHNSTQERHWSQSLRFAVLEHLAALDIKLSLLIQLVESYRFDAEVDELLEMIRAYDILGAERRFGEYTVLFYLKLKGKNEWHDWQYIYKGRLPILAEDLMIDLRSSWATKVGAIGSQKLIEYLLEKSLNYSSESELFQAVCNSGHLDIAKWLLSLGGGKIPPYESFQRAYIAGNLAMAQWLYTFPRFQFDSNVFTTVCHAGSQNTAEWLLFLNERKEIRIDKNSICRGFHQACLQGHLKFIQWLYPHIHSYIYTGRSLNELFREICLDQQIHIGEWLLTEGLVHDIQDIISLVFRDVCNANYLNMAKWVYSLGKIPISYQRGAFLNSCYQGHIKIVQWLYSLIGFIKEGDEEFQKSCHGGHLEVAQWIYNSCGTINIHANHEIAFRLACSGGHLQLLRWLHSLSGIDIHVRNDEAFRSACLKGHFTVAQWLYSLGGIDIHSNDNEVMKKTGYHSELHEWLQSLDEIDQLLEPTK